MTFALLLIGLLPLAILPEFVGNPGDEDEADVPDLPIGDHEVLMPVLDDDLPGFTSVSDDMSVVHPNVEDDEPPLNQADGDPLLPVNEIESELRPLRLSFEEVVATGYAEISGFDPDHDVIQLSIEDTSLESPADVEVIPGDDWSDARVYVEGLLLAILPNAPDAGRHNIEVSIVKA